MSKAPLGLFQGVGLEIEYMVVDRRTLDVRPLVDTLFKELKGRYVNSVDRGSIAWSNELAVHVLEMKTNGPVPALEGVAETFHHSIAEANELLADHGAMLLPSGMHPWMDPDREFVLWTHGDQAIYRALHRIFDCRGPGWSNLQSMHINLPFNGADEFGRLHAAIRLVLPLLPALAASSPFEGGRATGALDTRLTHYATNARRLPSITGDVIPEALFTPKAYQEKLLQRLYHDLAPLDPKGTLQYEWINARGAIARFDRSAIEIRLLDTQECPSANVAVAAAVTAVVEALVDERICSRETQQGFAVAPLSAVLHGTIRDGERTVIADGDYLKALGFTKRSSCRAGTLWGHLLERYLPHPDLAWRKPLDTILNEGTLARRLRRAAGDRPTHRRLLAVYRQLARCLAADRVFHPRP